MFCGEQNAPYKNMIYQSYFVKEGRGLQGNKSA